MRALANNSVVTLAILFLLPLQLHGEQPSMALAKARKKYEESLKSEIVVFSTYLEKAIASHTRRGNLETAVQIKELKDKLDAVDTDICKFLTTVNDETILTELGKRIRSHIRSINKARRRLSRAYDAAILAYRNKGDLNTVLNLKSEQSEMTSLAPTKPTQTATRTPTPEKTPEKVEKEKVDEGLVKGSPKGVTWQVALEELQKVGANVRRSGKNVELRGKDVNDDVLKYIPALKTTRLLAIYGAPHVTDEGLKYIAGSKSLEELYLYNTSITDKGLKSIGQMKRLIRLGIIGTPITDDGLVHLRTLTRLNSLLLKDTMVTGPGLACVKNMKRLVYISLLRSPITDEGLVHLKGLKLINVSLSGAGITDAGMRHLKDMKTLKYLTLEDTAVTDDGIAALRGLTRLESLSLTNSPLPVKQHHQGRNR